MRKEIEEILQEYASELPIKEGLINSLTALFESKLEEAKRPIVQQLTYIPEHEKLRREHWSRVYCCMVLDENNSHDFCKSIADQALEAFDNKFKSEG